MDVWGRIRDREVAGRSDLLAVQQSLTLKKDQKIDRLLILYRKPKKSSFEYHKKRQYNDTRFSELKTSFKILKSLKMQSRQLILGYFESSGIFSVPLKSRLLELHKVAGSVRSLPRIGFKGPCKRQYVYCRARLHVMSVDTLIFSRQFSCSSFLDEVR